MLIITYRAQTLIINGYLTFWSTLKISLLLENQLFTCTKWF